MSERTWTMVRRDKFIAGSLVAGVMAFAGFLLVLNVSDYQLRERLAGYEPPESVRAYRKRLAASPAPGVDKETRNTVQEPEVSTTLTLSTADLLNRISNAVNALPLRHKQTAIYASFWLDDNCGFEDISSTRFTFADVESLINDADAVLSDIRELSRRDPVVDIAEDTWAVFSPHLYGKTLLEIGAAYEAYTGQPRRAFEHVISGVRIANALMRTPSSSCQTWACDLDDTLVAALAREFGPGDLPSSWIDELLPLLHGPHSLQMALDATSAEAADFVRLRPQVAASMSYKGWVEEEGLYWGTRNWLWGKPICRPMTNMDDRGLLDMATRIREIPDLPFCRMKPYLAALENYGESLSIVRHTSRRYPMHVARILRQISNCAVSLDLARVGLLLERHRAVEGFFPESLQALLGDDVPVDPFTGEPYGYMVTDAGFLLYSSGEDGADDLTEVLQAAADPAAAGELDDYVETASGKFVILHELLFYIDDVIWRPTVYFSPLLARGTAALANEDR